MKSLICLVVCLNCCIAPESNSFIDNYKMYMEKHYHKFHKLAERYSVGSINASDSLLFIPLLTICKDVEKNSGWDYYAPHNNAKYASFDNLDYKQNRAQEFILYTNNRIVKLYNNMRLGRRVEYMELYPYVSNELMELVMQYEPDGIFTVYNISGWFFIIGEKIVFVELSNGELFYHENACEVLNHCFTQPDFIPVFTGEAL